MEINERDRKSAIEAINWFARAAYDKCMEGSRCHGGTLVAKGGLLAEAENECLDHVIYTRAIRYQLDGILDALNRGDVDTAKRSLHLLLRGKTSDTLPSSL